MAEVFLNPMGDGTASCDSPPPMVEGERFTITFSPNPGATLDSVRAFDSHDYSVALPPVVNNQITMTWRSVWGNLYVDIYFSGSPTPPPPTPNIPPWLLFKIKERRKNVK
jgi:hypothetical protein